MMNKNILVIDDEEDILEFVERVLRDEGYNVFKAKDAKQGLAILQSEKIDLILLDIMLPEIDGWQFMQMLKSEERLKKIPVAMLTARVDAYDKIIGLKEGAVDYICKPFTADQLLKRINDIFYYIEKNNL
jgi:DNA-binding response OmpR family regulator|uniref:Response regulator n=1 Tax=candidate division WOR-3 bacterium TaxID=2052148 RepID=A0A7V3RIE6_UNCW3